jgi:DNA polymerase-3 subunit beta
MKLICTKDNFKKAIYNCEKIVYKKNTLPILNNILFETEKGGLKLSTTNLEIGISSKLGAKIEKEGKITIPARLISNFSSNLISDGDNISLEVEDDKLKIKSGANKAIIKGIPANDFPLIPNKKSEYILELNGNDLRKIFSKIIPSVAVNEARQELTGINLILKEKELFFAATDSFRLAECKLKINGENIKESYGIFIKKTENIIIPASTIIELNRIISDQIESRVKIAVEEGQIFFETNGTKIVSRLIIGKYPEYKHIIPKEYKTKIIGPQTLMQNAIRMASVFSFGGNGEITLKIDAEAKKIFITSKSAEVGENSTELNFDIIGASQSIIFNGKYILDGINVIGSPKLAILANSESTPVAIKEVDEKTGEILEDFTYIVMPIKN